MSSSVHEVEVTIAQMKEAIAEGEVLEKFIDSPEFKLIITEGYFDYEAKRLTMLLSDHTAPGDLRLTLTDKRNITIENLASIGNFRDYLQTVRQRGRSAKDAMESYEQELEYRLEEENEGGEV